MGVTGGGEVLIMTQQGMFSIRIHTERAAGRGGQVADLHTVIGASRKTATTARSSPTPTF